MFSQSTLEQLRGQRVSCIRIEKRPSTESQRKSMVPSVAHLSSFIQSAKKTEINKELLDFTQRASYTERQELKSTSELFLSSQKEPVKLPNFYKLQKEAIKKRKPIDGQIFLSDIAEQEVPSSPSKDHFKRLQHQNLLQSKRRNYLMRKLEFKNFLKVQQISKETPVPIQEPKQIEYENQKVKSKSVKFNIRNHSFNPFKN